MCADIVQMSFIAPVHQQLRAHLPLPIFFHLYPLQLFKFEINGYDFEQVWISDMLYKFDTFEKLSASYQPICPGQGAYLVKSMLNRMLVNKGFLTWRFLIGWWLCCQPIRCQAWKSLLINMDFNMDIP